MTDKGFARIDKALGIYYQGQVRDDYYDAEGVGKFLIFVEMNEFDENKIDLELGDDVTPNDCLYISMDDDFPLNQQNDDDSRPQQIFNIIKHCYAHGIPPNTEEKAPTQTMDATSLAVNTISYDFSGDIRKCDGTLSLCEHKTRLLYGLRYYQKLNVLNVDDQNKLMRFYKETYKELLNDFVHIISNHDDDLDEIYDDAMDDKALAFAKCNVLRCKWAQRHNRDRTKTDVDTEKIRIIDETLKQREYEDEEADPNERLKEEILRDFDCPQCKQDEYDRRVGVSDWVASFEPTLHHSCYTKQKAIADEIFYDVQCEADIDVEFVFIRDLFDAVHCHILHQYDFGYRIHRKDLEKEIDGMWSECKDESDDDQDYDNAFAVITEIIKKKKNILSHMPGFKNNDKFTIKQTGDDVTSKDVTLFMDKMYEEIQLQDTIDSNALRQTQTFLEKEEYDTDGMEMDLSVLRNENKSILNKSLDDKVLEIIYVYLSEYEVSKRSFSTGLILYYWEHYRDKTEIKNEFKHRFNFNDHGGYKPCELFVEKKYPDIKYEILNNEIYILNITSFKTALTKANKLMATRETRQLRTTELRDISHYGLIVGTIPKVSHLLSATLYTDWSELSTAFSKTFRKEYIYEKLESVVKRNQEFANWSRLLRETVEGFDKHYMRETFFCGMSDMTMPAMSIRLCGPTSTSAHVEVATRFAGTSGIIIKLKEYTESASFPCAWLSHYSGESEYLFMGGYFRIGIESIKHLSTKQTVETKYFKALFLFDCMVNGTRALPPFRHVLISILETLIKKALEEDRYVKHYPEYINNTFQKMIDSKKTLIFNYDSLKCLLEKEQDSLHKFILFYGFVTFRRFDDELYCDGIVDDNMNLFKPLIFKLFKNINKIVIYSNEVGRRALVSTHYPFGLTSLLSILLTPDIDIVDGFTIIIKTWRSSWLAAAFTPQIQSLYDGNNWSMQFTQDKSSYRGDKLNVESIVITKTPN